MSQSTPIYNIPRDNMQQNEQSREIQNMIDNNVDEMYEREYGEPSIDQAYQMQQSDMENYQMQNPGYLQQAQAPPMQMPQYHQQQQPQQQQQQHQQQQQMSPPSNLYVPNQLRGQMSQSSFNYGQSRQPQQPQQEEWMDYFLKEFKDSIIVAVLFVVLNVSIVQNILRMYIPYMDNVYLELVVRGVISGVLFYFARRYWKA